MPKKRTLHFLLFIIVALSLPALAVAQTQYVPLAPIDGVVDSDGKVNVTTYFPSMFKLGIAVASILAVLAIAYGGIQYMTSDVVTSKSAAIDHIKNALLGLLLAVSAYLLLYTIDPQLTGNDALEGLTDLPAPSAPAAPPPPQVPIGYKLTFYAASHTFTFQEYDCELYWAESGAPVTTKKRFRFKTLCDAEQVIKQAELGSSVVVNKRKVKRLDTNVNYYDTEFQLPLSYADMPPRPITAGELVDCQDQIMNLTNSPDKAYRNVIVTPCTKTQSGTPTTNVYTAATSGGASEALNDCRYFASLKPNAVITENCQPYYATNE